MIVIDVIQNSKELAFQISKYLISEKYALMTHIDTNRIYTGSNEIQTIRLFFVTKALLFDVIDRDIKEKFYSPELLIYATPVSHISKEFGEKLRLNLKAA
ncbi:MAG: hypothetical protein JNM51_09480 [Bacteroidia bacterium]|nr:hypothetical protein [Bacteroidia bacterium]